MAWSSAWNSAGANAALVVQAQRINTAGQKLWYQLPTMLLVLLLTLLLARILMAHHIREGMRHLE